MPVGELVLERTSPAVLGLGVGDTAELLTAHGGGRVRVVGLVHDPALAPAWQEHRGYGYIGRATLAALGLPPVP